MGLVIQTLFFQTRSGMKPDSKEEMKSKRSIWKLGDAPVNVTFATLIYYDKVKKLV